MVVLVAAFSGGMVRAEIIGPALINRTNVDTAANYMFLYDNGTSTPGFTHWGLVTSWPFTTITAPPKATDRSNR
jgi:hypothetical protein